MWCNYCTVPYLPYLVSAAHTARRHALRANHPSFHHVQHPTINHRLGPNTKMTSSELAATLSFLTDAGHVLAATAPETSAYLLSRRNGLMFEHEMAPSDKQREHVCTCCGHIMLLGQGSSLRFKQQKGPKWGHGSTRRSKPKPLQSRPSQPRVGLFKTTTCGYCSRATEVELPTPAPISRRNTKVQKVSVPSMTGVDSSLPPQEAPLQKTGANASSKRRAKSRKAGLQALLDQSDAARGSRPGFGLSLADFMEKK